MSKPTVSAAARGLPEFPSPRSADAPAKSVAVDPAEVVDAKLDRATLLTRVMALAVGEQAIIGESDARALSTLAWTIEEIIADAEVALQAERVARAGRQMPTA